MYACGFSDSWHSLRRNVRGCVTKGKGAHRNDDMRTVSIPRNDLEPLNGVCIADDVVQDLWSVLFDPEMQLRV